jgi:hypothetical protein
MTEARWSRMAASAAGPSAAVTASTMARCWPSDSSARPGTRASRNW